MRTPKDLFQEIKGDIKLSFSSPEGLFVSSQMNQDWLFEFLKRNFFLVFEVFAPNFQCNFPKKWKNEKSIELIKD